MSELLKKIIKSQSLKEDRFYLQEDGRVFERIVTAEDTFTGYYQDAGGTLYTKEGWEAEKERQYKEFEEKKRLELVSAQKERAAQVAAKKEAAANAVINRGKKKKKHYKLYGGLLAVAIMISVLVFGLWERDYTREKEAIAAEETQAEVKEEVIVFGDALITGDGVNLRFGPSTSTEIIDTFDKMGERVEVIPQDSVVPKWEKVRRENGVQGWVYDLYLKKLEE
ncbi:SH3 domain-containing protein [Dokdonia sp. Hel_I_53]|uniref:SH3 domain-containing protein n=1 Tax=Dokdonia sp. Hel_I_53 TaxID=1566287 RepID=UPI00119BA346|nr:SH3 domain-containing protein [Dokdonia sp. Hel_I_53]TVZ52415.1 SH3 domain-containing protein [Dokdonia sp. Hel_I_53]